MSKVTLEKYGSSLEINELTNEQVEDWLKRVEEEVDDELHPSDLRDVGEEVESTSGLYSDNELNNHKDIKVNLNDCECISSDFITKSNSYYAVLITSDNGCFGEIDIDLEGKKFDPELLTIHTTCYDNLTELSIVDSFEYDGKEIEIDSDNFDPEIKTEEIYIIKTGEDGGFDKKIYDSTV